MNSRTIAILLLAALAGCRPASGPRTESGVPTAGGTPTPPAQSVPAPAPPPTQPAPATAPSPACAEASAYPLPRAFEQVLADARPGARQRTGVLEALVIISPEGNPTHLRFTRLSESDEANRRAYDFVIKQHYKVPEVGGQRYQACTTISINVDYQ